MNNGKFIDMKFVKSHLKAVLADDDIDDETGYEAHNASQALEEIRGLFRGTPIENALTEIINLCDTVASEFSKR
jgi:hypothetical protein